MSVVSLTCVKNESDIIEPFVRHTAAVVDRLVILDNGSTDGTLNILRALEREGLPLDIVEDRTIGKFQWLWMTRLMREYAFERYGAEWVLPMDADEFYVGRLPQGAVATRAATRSQPLKLGVRLYLPTAADDSREMNPAVRIRWRVHDGYSNVAKVLIPGSLARRADAVVSQGNHDVVLDGQPCAGDPWPDAYLAHLPMRSFGQYLSKIAVPSLQYIAMNAASYPYQREFLDLRQDPAVLTARIRETQARPPEATGELVEAPIPYLGGPVMYTPVIDDATRPLLALISSPKNWRFSSGRYAGATMSWRTTSGDPGHGGWGVWWSVRSCGSWGC